MGNPGVYFDHAATTPVRAEVLEAMLPAFTGGFGNPSSLYRQGKLAKKMLQQAKTDIAGVLGIEDSDSLFFTSGGTESNNLAIKGLAFGLQGKGKHIITSAIEHDAVLQPCAWLQSQGWEVTYLPVDTEGFISTSDLENAIRPDTVLISLIHGNNEVGTVQPIVALGEVARRRGVLFHTDAVQTVGKLALNLDALPVDLLTASGHKLYGPKGVGLLYANAQARGVLTPWLHGGGQQQGLRSGTENIPGIAGLARALVSMSEERETVTAQLYRLQEKLILGVTDTIPGAVLNGPRDVHFRVPGNVHFSFPPIEGETLVLRLDLAGLAVSSGSACHSAELKGSHVLYAMGKPDAVAKSTLRISLGKDNTLEEVDQLLTVLPGILEKAGYFKNPVASQAGPIAPSGQVSQC